MLHLKHSSDLQERRDNAVFVEAGRNLCVFGHEFTKREGKQ